MYKNWHRCWGFFLDNSQRWCQRQDNIFTYIFLHHHCNASVNSSCAHAPPGLTRRANALQKPGRMWGGGGMGAAGIDRCIDHARKAFGFENAKSLIPDTGKNNRFLFLDILGYLKKIIPTKIPNLEEWDKSQSGNSLVPTCLTLPNLGFL